MKPKAEILRAGMKEGLSQNGMKALSRVLDILAELPDDEARSRVMLKVRDYYEHGPQDQE